MCPSVDASIFWTVVQGSEGSTPSPPGRPFLCGGGASHGSMATPGHPAMAAAPQVPTSWDACLCLLFNELWSIRSFSVSLGVYQAVFLQPEAQALLRAPALEPG